MSHLYNFLLSYSFTLQALYSVHANPTPRGCLVLLVADLIFFTWVLTVIVVVWGYWSMLAVFTEWRRRRWL